MNNSTCTVGELLVLWLCINHAVLKSNLLDISSRNQICQVYSIIFCINFFHVYMHLCMRTTNTTNSYVRRGCVEYKGSRNSIELCHNCLINQSDVLRRIMLVISGQVTFVKCSSLLFFKSVLLNICNLVMQCIFHIPDTHVLYLTGSEDKTATIQLLGFTLLNATWIRQLNRIVSLHMTCHEAK